MELISRKTAIEKGLTRYFTGIPCVRGHLSERYIYAKCVQCAKEDGVKGNALNPERAKAAKEKYKQNNKEKVAISKRKNYEKNKERYRLANKEFALKNREKVLSYYKKSREKNKEKRKEVIAKYRKDNAGKVNSWTAKRRALKKKATPLWANLPKIEEIYKKAKTMNMHVDHIVPLSNPLVCGLHVEFNLQLLTPIENSKKNNIFSVED